MRVYVAYVIVAVVLTAWLARTLFQSGAAFLHEVFDGKAQLSQAVNRLLVVGFYILNLYALYILQASRGLEGFDAVQFLVNRLAVLLVSLAAIHFVNMLVFW